MAGGYEHGEAEEGRHWGLTVALFGAAAASALLVFVLIVSVGRTAVWRDSTLAQERRSYEVLLTTRSVEASMGKAEAALGRYAISADRTMGSIYYDQWVLAGSQITRLERLVAADREAAALVDRLANLYSERGDELGAPAQHAARRQGWPALNLFNAAGHSARISEIDRTLAAIRAHELAILDTRADQSDNAAFIANRRSWMLSLAGMLLVGTAGALVWGITSAVARRRHAEAKADNAADRAAWLREAVADRTEELSAANLRLQHEMTERAAAEAKLRQVQKMDAVGQLTGGIAHDFNNMLAVVVGGLDLAKRRLDNEMAEVGQHLDRALEGANRAAELTRRLLGFARAEPLLPEYVDPPTMIAAMSALLDRTLGERIVVETQVAPDCWPIWVDPVQLENAVVNLAVNGRDAMDGVGRLLIAARNVRLRKGEIGDLAAGDYARLSVADTGTGMTPQVLERAFEPFFTTKPVGRGTGLGLSQIFGFVRQSGGDVAVETAPDRGTTVSLYLPRAADHAVSAAVPPIAAPRGNSVVHLPRPAPAERMPVLVVEDDPRVRAATVGALTELGYLPVACADAAEALAALDARADLSVMVTDVVMPGVTGTELAAIVRRRRPDVGILFVTGYAGDDAHELGGEAVLRKPFTIVALEKAMAAIFARSGVSARPLAAEASARA
jgi:signal transduction histidine kinase/CheY-like chemotaxis protein